MQALAAGLALRRTRHRARKGAHDRDSEARRRPREASKIVRAELESLHGESGARADGPPAEKARPAEDVLRVAGGQVGRSRSEENPAAEDVPGRDHD